MRRVLSELECLEWEARQQPSPPPRVCEPWDVVLTRQEELLRNWLPSRGFCRHEYSQLRAAANFAEETVGSGPGAVHRLRPLGQPGARFADVPSDEVIDHAGAFAQPSECAEGGPAVIGDAHHPVRGVGLGQRHVHSIALAIHRAIHRGCGFALPVDTEPPLIHRPCEAT
jgi:hypothetical protein